MRAGSRNRKGKQNTIGKSNNVNRTPSRATGCQSSVVLRQIDRLLAALNLDEFVWSPGSRSFVVLILDTRSSLVVALGDGQ